MTWIGLGISVVVYMVALAFTYGKFNQKVEQNAKDIDAVHLDIAKQIMAYEKADMESKKRLHDRIDSCEKELTTVSELRQDIKSLAQSVNLITGKLEALIEMIKREER